MKVQITLGTMQVLIHCSLFFIYYIQMLEIQTPSVRHFFYKLACNIPSCLFFLLLFGLQQNAYSQSRIYGEMTLETNYVDKGLSQSEQKPAFETGLGYMFNSQGRIGFQAASVSYANESVNLEMRLLGEYRFIFNSSFDLRVREDITNYSASGQRNNMIMTFDFGAYGYHTLISQENNFEGTKTQRTWLGFHKDWLMGGGSVGTTVGYSLINSSSGYTSYFDTRLGYTYNFTNTSLSLYNTYNSGASQFGGRGDLSFFAAIQVKF
jgi:uncharacterized protein (TIGR02001 family)